VKARIRGIYATALTKLFLDAGWEIVQPSQKIVERLSIKPSYEPPDITLKDDEEVQGALIIIGRCRAVDEALNLLTSTIPSLIILRAVARIKQVVIGQVINEGGRTVVKLPDGLIGEPDRGEVLFEGSVRVFTIVSAPFTYSKPVKVVSDIIIEGDLVELYAGNRKVMFSRYIPSVERDRLSIIGSQVLAEGFGIRFKSSAQYADNTAILREIDELKKRILEIRDRASSLDRLDKLTEGKCLARIYLSKRSKEYLDDVRKSVVPTVKGHHELRPVLRDYVELLDAVSSECSCDLYKGTVKWILNTHPITKLVHIKVSGDVIVIGPFIEQKILENGLIVLKRRLRPGHVLDGLGKVVNEGDYALTCIDLNSNYLVHSYYDKNGSWKGSYVNINTEPEVGLGELRYIDLEIDVIYDENGVKLIDIDKLNLPNIILSNDLRDRIENLVSRLTGLNSVRCSLNGIEVRQ